MKTVHEVSKLTGVSVRALHHYDLKGLLKPSSVSVAGYRLYDTPEIMKLQNILLFKELGFSLEEIKAILNSPDFDRREAICQQIKLLELKREQLDSVIALARSIQEKGVNTMEFKAFDKSKLDEYTKQAKEQWGNTEAYKEFEQKNKTAPAQNSVLSANALMQIFAQLGELNGLAPDDKKVQAKIAELKAFITENYYTCTNEILASLGEMYVSGGEMTQNINAAGGEGTAELAAAAIKVFCKK